MIHINNKKIFLRFLLAALHVFIFASLVSCNLINFSGVSGPTVEYVKPSAEANTVTGTSVSSGLEEKQILSQQPDETAFKDYFGELGLGKLPSGGNLPADLKKDDNIFISYGLDHLVIYGYLLKDAKLSNAVYDIISEKNLREKAEFPVLVRKGGFAGSEPVNLPPGLYEYKIWIGDSLVGVFPFEVKP
ncbi:MAG: hypothetical protein ACYCXK_04280 [Candidatus Humimicrobiaceae bacterium]